MANKPTRAQLIDRAIEICEQDEQLGICRACGNEQSAEPDARGYICDACGAPDVYGAEETLFLGAA